MRLVASCSVKGILLFHSSTKKTVARFVDVRKRLESILSNTVACQTKISSTPMLAMVGTILQIVRSEGHSVVIA